SMPIDNRNLERYGLFQLFWNTHNDPHLSGGGLNEVTAEGAQKLYEYALKHNLDGTDSMEPARKIDDEEKAVIKALLEDPHYGAFFEQDGKVKLIQLFNLDPADIHAPQAVVHPKDEGNVELGPRVSVIKPSQLANVDPQQLPQLFTEEYKRNVGHYEDKKVTPEVRAQRTLALLRDYSEALWARGENGNTEAIGHALLDAFEKTRSGKLVSSKNFNGAPWGVAQSLVLGIDPNSFATKFPDAHKSAETTYLAMNDGMVKAMSHVDEYRAAKGLPKAAESYERQSPLNFLIGEEPGHLKRGNLDEKTPFASSGVNWGIAMFPGDKQIRDLPPKQGFEFPIDCLDSFGNFLSCNPKRGEQLAVVDQNGNRLNVEKVIEEKDGKPVAWSAKFTDAQGKEVEASKVLGVITSQRGLPAAGQKIRNTKGDGRASGSVNMWWWGFCDRNTAQQLYKSKFKIPQLDRETIKVKAGDKIVSFPKAEAQKLIDADIPDIVTNETMCGFRFNSEPQMVALKNGQQFTAKLADSVFESGTTTRIGEDMVSLHDGPGRPILGEIQLKQGDNTESIAVKNIVSITKDEATGKVTVKVKDGWRDTLEGELATDVPWNKAKQENGKLVLEQTAEHPIRGALKMTLDDGTEKYVSTSEISQIVGEMQKDLRISQYAAWVSHNQGMFATDSSTGEVVSNGMRWVNKIDSDVREGEDRPAWAPEGELRGIQGALERVAGDKIVWMRGLFAYEKGQEPSSEAFEGWVQVDKNGRILNEGFTSGQPDFGWSADGPLDWKKPSSFNPHMDADLRIALFVNGVKERGADLEALAQRLNLPANYKDYLVAQDGE
ncbi:hypothetical protein L6R52_40505, partial [Myxococcota bacterium]|nr:hypothetical protein [Myxococcota bacterium]